MTVARLRGRELRAQQAVRDDRGGEGEQQPSCSARRRCRQRRTVPTTGSAQEIHALSRRGRTPTTSSCLVNRAAAWQLAGDDQHPVARHRELQLRLVHVRRRVRSPTSSRASCRDGTCVPRAAAWRRPRGACVASRSVMRVAVSRPAAGGAGSSVHDAADPPRVAPRPGVAGREARGQQRRRELQPRDDGSERRRCDEPPVPRARALRRLASTPAGTCGSTSPTIIGMNTMVL